MSYVALYRKFRPSTFDEVRGQDHIVTTLKNQIKNDRIGHAYIFNGTRGTGKTSIAKIMAKAVNCETPIDGSPCGKCAMCRSIDAGTSMNAVEIDAASNNGVENIRDIRDEVTYAPTEGRYRVYIIDEAHMLSNAAFNALLKTLEEPPSYVIFILATTEVFKVPITILSRCQRYDFRRITPDTICSHLKKLVDEEKVEAEEKALLNIARKADGSMRDALSLLDQCIAFYPDEKLTYERVLDVLGTVDAQVYGLILTGLLKEDAVSVLGIFDNIVEKGGDIGQFVNEFTGYLRDVMIVKSTDDTDALIDMSEENLQYIRSLAADMEYEKIFSYIKSFSELSSRLRYATSKRILTEALLIRLCVPSMQKDEDAVLARLSALERRMDKMPDIRDMAKDLLKRETISEEKPPLPKKQAVMPDAVPEEVEQAVREWNKIINALSPVAAEYAKEAQKSLDDAGSLLLVFENHMAYSYYSDENSLNDLKAAITEHIGRNVTVRIAEISGTARAADLYPDLEQWIRTKIEIDEE